jgi:hypothetical protein
LAAAVLCLGVSAQAAVANSYDCAAWTPKGSGQANLSSLSIGKTMITYKAGGPNVTARMFHSTLTRKTYAEDRSLFIIHGAFQKRADGSPGFGPKITVQRLIHAPQSPTLLATTCEMRR